MDDREALLCVGGGKSIFSHFPAQESVSNISSGHLCCLQFEFELNTKEFSVFLHNAKELWALKDSA